MKIGRGSFWLAVAALNGIFAVVALIVRVPVVVNTTLVALTVALVILVWARIADIGWPRIWVMAVGLPFVAVLGVESWLVEWPAIVISIPAAVLVVACLFLPSGGERVEPAASQGDEEAGG